MYFFLGDPDDLVATGTEVSSLEDWRDLSALNLLYLNYDVTPASLVDAIITEISVIPCTSGLTTNTIFSTFCVVLKHLMDKPGLEIGPGFGK